MTSGPRLSANVKAAGTTCEFRSALAALEIDNLALDYVAPFEGFEFPCFVFVFTVKIRHTLVFELTKGTSNSLAHDICGQE